MQQLAHLDHESPDEAALLLTQEAFSFINTMPFQEQLLAFIGVDDAQTLHNNHDYWFYKYLKEPEDPDSKRDTFLIVNLDKKKDGEHRDFLIIHLKSEWLPKSPDGLFPEKMSIVIRVIYYNDTPDLEEEDVQGLIFNEVVNLIDQDFPSIPASYFMMRYSPEWSIEEQRIEGLDLNILDFTFPKQIKFHHLVLDLIARYALAT